MIWGVLDYFILSYIIEFHATLYYIAFFSFYVMLLFYVVVCGAILSDFCAMLSDFACLILYDSLHDDI